MVLAVCEPRFGFYLRSSRSPDVPGRNFHAGATNRVGTMGPVEVL
jgi:hypothetical protein